MSVRRLLAATVMMMVFSVLWNGLVHLVVLEGAERALVALTRPSDQRSFVLALLLTGLLAFVFAWSFATTVRAGVPRPGLVHGLFFAIIAGLLVDFNQFIVYPIPGHLALAWFGFGVVEFCIWGLIAAKVVRS